MPNRHIPSYTFITAGNKRSFHHRWHFRNAAVAANEEVVQECSTCHSICLKHESYARHWHKKQTNYNNEVTLNYNYVNNGGMSETLKRNLKLIASHNVQCFMLCNPNMETSTQEFLLDAGINAIPKLLNILFNNIMLPQQHHLIVRIAFFAKISIGLPFEMMITSSDLEILHYYDIQESVDMIFNMLLQKLLSYLETKKRRMTTARISALETDYEIKRIALNIRRVKGVLRMPLQFRVKKAVNENALNDMGDLLNSLPSSSSSSTSPSSNGCSSNNSLVTTYTDISCESPTITTNNFNFQSNTTFTALPHCSNANSNLFPTPYPNANYYCFRICATSQELYAVPYHLASSTHNFKDAPSYILLQNITNTLHNLLPIANVRRFLCHDSANRILTCHKCCAKFMQRTAMTLHQMLHCGREFELLKMATDTVEIYENCLQMQCDELPWSIYGIMPECAIENKI